MGLDDGRNFLSSHREYLIWFEDQLIAAGGIPIPYWDWYSTSTVPAKIDDRVELEAMGVAREWDRPTRVALPTASRIAEFWEEVVNGSAHRTFERWQGVWEREFHNTGHRHIGGTMGDARISPTDPIFWMHHAFVDKFWADLQSVGASLTKPQNMTEAFEPTASFSHTVADVIDFQNAGKYTYEELFRIPVVTSPRPGVMIA